MIRDHWWFSGPGPAIPAGRLLRRVDVRGGHAHTLRRLLRIGPWGIYAIRYQPGHIDEDEQEKIP